MAVIGMMSSLRPRSATCVTPGGTFCHRGLTVAPTGFLGTPTNPQLVIRQQLIQIPRELIHRRTKPFLQFQLPDKAPSSPAQGPRSWLGGSLEVVNAWKLKPKQPQSPLQGLQSGSEKCYLAVLAAGVPVKPYLRVCPASSSSSIAIAGVLLERSGWHVGEAESWSREVNEANLRLPNREHKSCPKNMIAKPRT